MLFKLEYIYIYIFYFFNVTEKFFHNFQLFNRTKLKSEKIIYQTCSKKFFILKLNYHFEVDDLNYILAYFG